MSERIEEATVAEAPTDSGSIRWSSIILWTAVIAVLALMGWGLLDVNATRPEAGEQAPAFTMEFFNGYDWQDQPITDLSDMEGKVVVVNFWASWCVECHLEADLLEATWRKYQDQGVVFVGIAYADVEPESLAYLQEFDVTYPNAPDLGTKISRDYEITGVPETFFIGKDGRIAHVQIGPVDQTMLDGIIGQLLAEG